ncbi:MAG: hypothetical protein ACO24H_11130 [Polynucleobacter sp.]
MRLKVGSAMLDMRPDVAIITLALIRALYVPTIFTLTLDLADMKHTTLLISFDYLPDLIKEFRI